MDRKENKELLNNELLLGDIFKYNIYLDDEDKAKYNDAASIILDNGFSVASNFISDLYHREDYFHELFELISNQIDSIKVGASFDEREVLVLELNKADLAKALIKMKDLGYEAKDSNEEKLIDKIISSSAVEVLYDKEQYNQNVSNVDDKLYSFEVSDYLNLLTMPNEAFEASINSAETINAASREIFVYSALKYFRESKALKHYRFSKEASKRYDDLMSLKLLDMQALNQFLDDNSEQVVNVSVDSDIAAKILEDIPHDYDELEKAMHIYIKMCKTFSYDDEYYVGLNSDIVYEPFEKGNYLSIVDEKIVCYEFNLVYAKYLNDLGLAFLIDEKETTGIGRRHANLVFRSGKFLVRADAVNSVFKGDVFGAKENLDLKGLIALNKNEKTQEEFKEKLDKVYENIKAKETKKPSKNILKTAEFKEKVNEMLNNLNNSSYEGMDAFSYAIKLKNDFFNHEEKLNNFAALLVKDNNHTGFNESKAAMLMAINEDGFLEKPDNNAYVYYNPQQGIKVYPQYIIEDRLVNGDLEYLNPFEDKLPGINIGEKTK